MPLLLLLGLVKVYPVDFDPAVKTFVEKEVTRIISVTEHPEARYTVNLVKPSIGNSALIVGEDIMVRPQIATNAMKGKRDLWLFRMLIAHELAHSMLGHHYTTSARQRQHELEADAKGIEYFRRLGWPCSWWADWRKRSASDLNHDMQAMYEQAKRLCAEQTP